MTRPETPARKKWIKPELKKLNAGSAEAISNKGMADGGKGFGHKS